MWMKSTEQSYQLHWDLIILFLFLYGTAKQRQSFNFSENNSVLHAACISITGNPYKARVLLEVLWLYGLWTSLSMSVQCLYVKTFFARYLQRDPFLHLGLYGTAESLQC